MPLLTFAEIDEKSRDAALAQFGELDLIFLDQDKKKTLPVKTIKKEPIVVLGHTQDVEGNIIPTKTTKIGELSAKEMANKFSQIYKGKEKQIKDIYLVACEAGWQDSPQKPCYARKLAYELYNKGFTNIKVHAVTSPPVDAKKYKGMRVELTTQMPAMQGAVEKRAVGDATAFLCTEKYEQLEEQARKNPKDKQLQEDLRIEASEHCIMRTSPGKLKTELERDENTFIGADKPQKVQNTAKKLKDEMARTPKLKIERVYAKGMADIQAQKKNMRQRREVMRQLKALKVSSKDEKKINSLIKNIEKNTDKWKELIREARSKARENEEKKSSSEPSLYQLLNTLIEKNGLDEGSSSQAQDSLSGTKGESTTKSKYPNTHKDLVKHGLINETPDLLSGKNIEMISSEKESLLDNQLKNVSNYYPYDKNPRRYHFWSARVPNDQTVREALSMDLDDLKGDKLKGEILRNFKIQLDGCKTQEQLSKRENKIKQSEEYKILQKSQGLFTFVFGNLFKFKKTDSVKAFEAMVHEREQGFSNGKG